MTWVMVFLSAIPISWIQVSPPGKCGVDLGHGLSVRHSHLLETGQSAEDCRVDLGHGLSAHHSDLLDTG